MSAATAIGGALPRSAIKPSTGIYTSTVRAHAGTSTIKTATCSLSVVFRTKNLLLLVSTSMLLTPKSEFLPFSYPKNTLDRGLGIFYISSMEAVSVGELKTSFSEVLKIDNISSYEIGKKYFGKYGSGNGRLSQDYKKRLNQKLYEKYSSR